MFGKVKRFWKRARSAVTGRFIKVKEAQKDPERTVVEKVEHTPIPDAWWGFLSTAATFYFIQRAQEKKGNGQWLYPKKGEVGVIMAWRLKDTPENRRKYPNLVGETFIGEPPRGYPADFYDSLLTQSSINEIELASYVARCPCICHKLPEFTTEEAKRAFFYLMPGYNDNPTKEAIEELRQNMTEELEHCDITGGDPVLSARIVFAHRVEDIDYYTKLKKAGL